MSEQLGLRGGAGGKGLTSLFRHSGRERLKTKLSLEFVDTLDAVATEVSQEHIGEGWDECHQPQLSRSSQLFPRWCPAPLG